MFDQRVAGAGRAVISKKQRAERKRQRDEARRGHNFKLAYGSEERVEWIRSFRCSTCRDEPSPSEASHVVAKRPRGRGGPEQVIPQGPACHRELHALGAKTFERRRGMDPGALLDLAEFYDKMWVATEKKRAARRSSCGAAAGTTSTRSRSSSIAEERRCSITRWTTWPRPAAATPTKTAP